MQVPSIRDANVLRLGEEAESVAASFASDAAGLYAAKRSAQIAHHPAIHPCDSRVDSRRDAMSAGEVLGKDRGRQSVLGAIRKGQRLSLVLERLNGHDRSENFLLFDDTICI